MVPRFSKQPKAFRGLFIYTVSYPTSSMHLRKGLFQQSNAGDPHRDDGVPCPYFHYKLTAAKGYPQRASWWSPFSSQYLQSIEVPLPPSSRINRFHSEATAYQHLCSAERGGHSEKLYLAPGKEMCEWGVCVTMDWRNWTFTAICKSWWAKSKP